VTDSPRAGVMMSAMVSGSYAGGSPRPFPVQMDSSEPERVGLLKFRA
jgi:hypothetical protein